MNNQTVKQKNPLRTSKFPRSVNEVTRRSWWRESGVLI